MEKMHFDLIRLGSLRADMALCEPYLRDSDLVSMDMSSVKASGGIEVAHPGPNGFLEDEICSLSRYAGISDKVSSFGLFWDGVQRSWGQPDHTHLGRTGVVVFYGRLCSSDRRIP